MGYAAKKEKNEFNREEDAEMVCFIKTIFVDGSAEQFESRIAQLVLWEGVVLPFRIHKMVEVFVRAYGRSPCPCAQTEFGLLYRAPVVRDLLDGKSSLVSVGKKRLEILFLGALLLLLHSSSEAHELAKKEWNRRVQRHYKLP